MTFIIYEKPQDDYHRRGGLAGGPARAKKLSPQRRREIGLMGVEAYREKLRKSKLKKR